MNEFLGNSGRSAVGKWAVIGVEEFSSEIQGGPFLLGKVAVYGEDEFPKRFGGVDVIAIGGLSQGCKSTLHFSASIWAAALALLFHSAV